MRKVTIWGTTLKKVADEAQMISHYKIIKKFVPDADVTMLTYLKPSVQAAYPNLTITPVSWLFKSLPRIFNSDLFVVGGGPFFDDFKHVLRVFFLALCLKLGRVPVLVYGVTGFPIKSWFGRVTFRFLVNQAEMIVTRDEAIYNVLQDLEVTPPMRLGIDLRAILEPSTMERTHEILRNEGIDPQKPMIGLTVRYIHKDIPNWVKDQLNLQDEGIDRFNEALGKLVAALSKKAQVFIIAMNPDISEDLAVAQNIRTFMDKPSDLKIIAHRYLATETLGIIKACDVLVAGRVGSAFFATMLETPLIAISHESRMSLWMEEVDAAEYCFDWQSLDESLMLTQIDKLNQSKDDIKRSFHSIAEEVRRQAWDDAEVYKKYLLA